MLPEIVAYRLEGKTGYGPFSDYFRFGYQYEAPKEWRDAYRNCPSTMPEPRQNTLIAGDRDAYLYDKRFAFPSTERLRYWFCSTALAYAHSVGAHLSILIVRRYSLYTNQIVYEPDSATKLSDVSLTALIGVPALPVLSAVLPPDYVAL
jgi:hypothetical protein